MPPASTASFTTSTARRICRHCFAEAYVDVALENFPHHAGCPRIEDFGAPVRAGLEQLADEMQPLFANSYGSPPVLPRQAEGFVGCGHCPALPDCARAGACGALIATSAEPGGYDEDDDREDDLATALRRPQLPEFRLAEKLRRIDEKFKADHPWLADRRRHWCRECGATAVEGEVWEHAGNCPTRHGVLVPHDWMIDFDPETLTARPPVAIDPRRRTAPHGDALETRVRTPYPEFFSLGFRPATDDLQPHVAIFFPMDDSGFDVGDPELDRDAVAVENGMGC